MLTRSGWLTGISGVALVIAGRIFGLIELFVLGAAALGLVALTIFWLLLRPRNVTIRRQVSSARLHAGDASQVQVQLHNQGALPSPVLRVTDDVAGTRGAELELPPLAPGGSRIVGYRLPTDKRGKVAVGPLRTHTIDPFAMVRATKDVAGIVEVLVYPRIDVVPPPPRPPGDDARLAERQASQIGRSSDEFYALREYVVGDDLRRVHWPSTARYDEIMVRQDELPQQGRTTILLDTQAQAASPETFEEMVSATASLAIAARKRDDLVRLVSSDGTDTGFTPMSTLDPVLDYLAVVKQGATGELDRAAAMAGHGNPGSIVAITGSGGARRAGSLLSGAHRRAANATIVFGPELATSIAAAAALPSDLMVRVRPGDTFKEEWTRALTARSGGIRP